MHHTIHHHIHHTNDNDTLPGLPGYLQDHEWGLLDLVYVFIAFVVIIFLLYQAYQCLRYQCYSRQEGYERQGQDSRYGERTGLVWGGDAAGSSYDGGTSYDEEEGGSGGSGRSRRSRRSSPRNLRAPGRNANRSGVAYLGGYSDTGKYGYTNKPYNHRYARNEDDEEEENE